MCLDKTSIQDRNGQIVNNIDGSLTVYMPLYTATGILYEPQVLSKQCCLALDSTYSFDINTQKCMWSSIDTKCDIENPFKIVLNPKGNDGVLYEVDKDKSCILNVEFDYLFKIKCETLNSFLLNENPVNDLKIAGVQQLITEKETTLESYSNQITLLNTQIENTSYVIICDIINSSPPSTNNIITSTSFSNTGFGDVIPTITPLGVTSSSSGTTITPQTTPTQQTGNYCLTEPYGLNAWATILGPVRYQKFLDGDSTSYDCSDVNTIVQQHLISKSQLGRELIVSCNTTFGTKTKLINDLEILVSEQTERNNELIALNTELQLLTSEINDNCNSPIDMFETLSVSMTLNVVSDDNINTTVYEDKGLFPAIGSGLLYSYITSNIDSGFYVCGGDECEPLSLNLTGLNSTNDVICTQVLNDLLQTLYIESKLNLKENGEVLFANTLTNNEFASDWLHYSKNISDTTLLETIKGKKISIGLVVNHTCGDICILLDNIKINRVCNEEQTDSIFVSKSPGFELERIRDNKKSWVNTNSTKDFKIFDINETSSIRNTKYNVTDERLILNSKEIDLDIDIAAAIENDVWYYITKFPTILTGETICNPCVYVPAFKEFQDGISFEFQDGISYEFQNGGVNSGDRESICCGDTINFNTLITQSLSAITTVEEFEIFITSELIDVKNRQTLSSYPTLRALYDRYMDSYFYTSNNSSAFDYITIDQFAKLLDNYWVDIVEQVIPSTTIWGSVKKYSNTAFDTQKLKYKRYSTLFNENPFSGIQVPSPIYGTRGQSTNVDYSIVTIKQVDGGFKKVDISEPIFGNKIWVSQMNSSNEYIGTVNIIGN